ncbi:TPA: YdaU family protein [Stenotrophomonas maltophilia]|nr:YdaU family protein [Stenotrophomonas maltophilia]
MNYYEHHLGDYAQATAHLSFVEDSAYGRLLRKYYADEKPLPSELRAVQRLVGARTEEERDAVQVVLEEFFSLEADGWHNKRADAEIAKFNVKKEKARKSAEARWNANASEIDANASEKACERIANASPKHDERNALQSPDTNLQEEHQEQQHVQPLAARCRFADFWAAYPNKKGKQEAEKTWKRRKLDGRCDELIGHVRLMEAHDDGWRRGYVPMGSTYLNQARWEDVPQESARAGPQTGQSGRHTPKQVQGLMALEDFGNGGLDQARNCGGPQEAHVLGPGADPGSGGDPVDRRRLAGGPH